MKYKSKQTGEIISKELFREFGLIAHKDVKAKIDSTITIFNFLDSHFEPVYEVGDWVMQIQNWKSLPKGRPYQIKEIISDKRFIVDSYPNVGSWFSDFRPATPEEIEAANKKFPFEYSVVSNFEHSFTVEFKEEDIIRITNNDYENNILLSQSAWQEIGKRKGWTL